MASRTDINNISVTTPTITKVKNLKTELGLKSYEALINFLIDERSSIVANGDDNAK